jgi:hypothetical protein
VFDTWSKQNDTAASPAYLYGGKDVTGNPLGDKPDKAAWNAGNFVGAPAAAAGSAQYVIPLRVRVRALQIKLRIWDVKSRQTRQITIIQDV